MTGKTSWHIGTSMTDLDHLSILLIRGKKGHRLRRKPERKVSTPVQFALWEVQDTATGTGHPRLEILSAFFMATANSQKQKKKKTDSKI